MIPGMTNPDTPPETRNVDVKGRPVTIKQFTDAQVFLLSREARLASRSGTEGPRKVDAVARVFDILESVLVNDEDREYLMDLTVKGELELKDFLAFIGDGDEEQEQKPAVRRGRAAKR